LAGEDALEHREVLRGDDILHERDTYRPGCQTMRTRITTTRTLDA
jgi:hypothetical protein